MEDKEERQYLKRVVGQGEEALSLHEMYPIRFFCPWSFPGKEYWSGLPFPSLGDLPNQGNKPESLISPVLAGGYFTAE